MWITFLEVISMCRDEITVWLINGSIFSQNF
jgi:hypothetical protein